jgi:hypothetical protein
LSRWCREHLYEARDEVFVRLTLRMMVVMTAAMAALWLALSTTELPWWIAGSAYFALWGWLTPPVILMLHNTMHRPFIRQPRVLKKAHPYVMSILFGIPMGYAEHHLGMHHVEDNMPEDLSSTMRYQRDSFLHFLHYFFRFFLFVVVELPIYLAGKRRNAMARRAVLGEIGHLTVVGAALALDWRFGVVAFVVPLVTVRFLMMTGNWGQHAFLNTARRNDGLSNSVTCINSVYNVRAFNDGYHIGHHLKGNRHWTELPKDFLDNRRCLRARTRRGVRGARLLHGVGAALDGSVEGAREALRAARRPADVRRRGDRALEVARATDRGLARDRRRLRPLRLTRRRPTPHAAFARRTHLPELTMKRLLKIFGVALGRPPHRRLLVLRPMIMGNLPATHGEELAPGVFSWSTAT